MASTSTRAPFEAGTPEMSTFPPGARELRVPRVAPLQAGFDMGKAHSASEWTRRTWASFMKKAREVVRDNTGMLLVAASESFYASMNLAVKELSGIDPPVTTMQLIWIRMTITWLTAVAYMYYAKIPDPLLGPKGVRLLLAFRGVCGFFGLFGVYYALQYLSLADATVLTFLAPILTIFTGAMFLGERFSWKQVAAGLCSLVGVILIARPPFLFGDTSEVPSVPPDAEHAVPPPGDGTPAAVVTAAERLGAVGISILGALGATGVFTIIRAIGTRAHPLHNIVAFSSQCVIVSTVAMLAMRTHIVLPTRLEWLALFLMIGFNGFFAQVLMTMGLQRQAVGRSTMAVYIQVVYAIIFDQVFFHAAPSLLSILGTLIIVLSAVYVALTKEESAKSSTESPEDVALQEGLLAREADDDEELSAKAQEAS
ncbi:DMT family transporter [Phanerochaete sordida]|uniref:DMT family transporter n=1 Tax=Phanerochaete sordida TaxID=48140 RepID=A0A9P3LEK0_9APHY|nr:DMT family transporter [Phanerochaete sordida]